jgi:hypothetical protein
MGGGQKRLSEGVKEGGGVGGRGLGEVGGWVVQTGVLVAAVVGVRLCSLRVQGFGETLKS